MKLNKPQPGSYPESMGRYIDLVKSENILEEMLNEHIDTIELVTSLDGETLDYRYAPGKWTIPEIMQHLIDTERIFAYRALCIARNDQTPLPGYDENDYAAAAPARQLNDLVREFSVLRSSTMELLKSLDAASLNRKGTANGKEVSVAALLYAILGHEIHHRNVMEEKYIG